MMEWAKTVTLCGFLLMVFLASGTSALECHDFASSLYNGSKGESEMHILRIDKTVTCFNACMEVQGILSLANTVLLVTHRGCPGKEPDVGGGGGMTLLSDPHLTMWYNVSYCFSDLCNKNMSSTYITWSPEKLPEPEESDSTVCYAGLTTDPRVTPEGLTCRKGNSNCYSGQGNFTIGPVTLPVFIKTCQNPSYSCSSAESMSTGLLEMSMRGSCCQGSYCNGVKNNGRETFIMCWLSFFFLCAISLGSALL